MRIVEFIPEDLVVPELAARDKESALREMAAALAAHDGMKADDVFHVWLERERLASTGIGEGVAIPHGKLPQVRQPLAVVGRSREGIDFDSLDGNPAHLFFGLVAPVGAAGLHLKALARISRLLKDADFRHRLLGAADGAAMYRILVEEDERH